MSKSSSSVIHPMMAFVAGAVSFCSTPASVLGQELHRSEIYSGSLQSAALSEDADLYAVAVSPDGFIGLHRTKDGKRIAQLPRGLGHTTAMAFSANGKHFAAAVMDTDKEGKVYIAVRLWELARPSAFVDLKGHRADLSAIEFSQDGKLLAAGARDGAIRAWQVSDRKLLYSIDKHEESVRIAFSPDGKTLAAISQDRSLNLWDAVTGKLKHGTRLDSRDSAFLGVRYVPTGKNLYATSVGGQLHSCRAVDFSVERSIQLVDVEAPVAVTAISPNCVLVASSDEKTIILSDAQSGKVISKVIHGKRFDINHLSFSGDSKMLITGATVSIPEAKSEIILWKIEQAKK